MKNHRLPRLLAATALSAVAAFIGMPTAHADVVLHPGSIEATTGLTNWSFGSSYLSVSGSAGGFSSTASYTGDSVTMTIEGAQTYSYASGYSYLYTINSNLYFSQSFNQANIVVPDGGTAVVDLRHAGATIAPQVTVTGGSIVSSRYTTSASATNYSSYLDFNQ